MSARTSWLAVAVSGLVAAPLFAQESPLSAIPGKAPMVVQLRGWPRVLDRFKAAVKAAAPEHAEKIAGQLEAGVNELLMGRELKDVATEGPLVLVFTEVPTGDDDVPAMALVARTANYVKFRDGLLSEEERKALTARSGYETVRAGERDLYFFSKGDYAVVALQEKVIKLFQDKKAASLAGVMDKALEAKFLGADASFYVDVKAIYKQHGDAIDAAKGELANVIQQMEGQGLLSKDQIEIYKQMHAGAFQFIEDAERGVIAVDFPPEGFSLKIHAQVGEKSKTNELFHQSKALAGNSVGRLPGGAMIYSAGTIGQQTFRSSGALMMMGTRFGVAEPEKSVAEAVKELADMPVEDWASSTSLGETSVQVFRYRDPAKAVAATLKMYRGITPGSGFAGVVIKGKPEIKADEQKVNGIAFHGVKLGFDHDKNLEKLPEEVREQFGQMMKKFIGEEQRTWFGHDGTALIEVTAKDWPAAKKALELYFAGKAGLSADKGFVETRRKLPEKKVLEMYLDAAKYTHLILDSMQGVLGAQGIEVKPEELKGPPSYVGIAVGMESRNVLVDVWVPAEGVNKVMKVLGPLLKMIPD